MNELSDMSKKEPESPDWYDKSKLCKIRFDSNETGWAIKMGNGEYRLANTPIAGMADPENEAIWGDLVRIKPEGGLEIIERFLHE